MNVISAEVRDKGMEIGRKGERSRGYIIRQATAESDRHSHLAGPSREPAAMHLTVSTPSLFLWVLSFPHY